MNEITINCTYTDLVELDKLEPTQGALKKLEDEDFARMQKSFMEKGFVFPIYLWGKVTERDDQGRILTWDKTSKMIDGHQRRKTVMRMKETVSMTCSKFPVVYAMDETLEGAMQLILAANNTVGTLTKEGFDEFIRKNNFDVKDVMRDYRLLTLDRNEQIKKNKTDGLQNTKAPTYNIVSEFGESYKGFIIFADNETDWVQLCAMMDVKSKKSYKNNHKGQCRVMSYQEFMDRLGDPTVIKTLENMAQNNGILESN